MYYTTIVALGLFFISPLLSLPFILYDVYKQHKGGLVLFVLFLAVMAYLTPPVGDLYRHTRDYFRMEYYDLEAFIHTLKDDFVTQLFSYFLSYFHIRYPVARLVYTVIGFSIKFWIFNDIVFGKYSNRNYFILFLIFFCCSGFFSFVLSVRHGFASSLFFLGFYLFYVKRRFGVGIIMFILASAIHYTFATLSVLVIFLFFLKINISNKLFFLLVAIVGLFGLILSTFIINTFFIDQAGAYLEGEWGTEYQTTFKGWVMYWLTRVSVLPMFVFFLRNKIDKDPWNNVIYMFSLLFAMTFSLLTISGRLLGSLSGFLLYFYLRNNEWCSLKLERLIIVTSIFMFSCSIYTNRALFTNLQISAYSEIWKPLPVVLQHDYDKHWVNSHIRLDGDIKNKYK